MTHEQQPLTPLEFVRAYRRRGLDPIPVPVRSKNPNRPGWQREQIPESDLARRFPNAMNVGVRTGSLSAHHVDADLDVPEATVAASYFLPRTALIHGRPGSPDSHRWYVAPGVKTAQFEFAEDDADKSKKTMYIELRADGRQTIVPPSMHPSGERAVWSSFGEAAQVTAEALTVAVAKTAAATLFARHWPGQGSRHSADLALSGMLAHAGWNADDINEFVHAVAEAAGDEEWRGRGQGESSVKKVADGSPVNGAPQLAALLRDGNRVVSKARDWLGISTASANASRDTTPRDISDGVWETPEPLPDGCPPVDAIDPDMLPKAFAPWLIDIQQRMQVPLDFVAVGAIAVACALVGRRSGIYPKRRDDWLVIANLYAVIIGPPSVMKTPALAETLKPLDRLAAEAAEAYAIALAAYDAQVMVVEARKKAISKEMEKAAISNDEVQLQALAAQVAALQSPKPTPQRFKTNDGTVEKIAELLLENPNGLLIFRDELSGWLRSLDEQGHETDRAFYLEAWSGDGSHDVDRIGRGSLHIRALCLSILGGIQPGPLTNYGLQASKEGGAGNDGLLQRFGLAVWPDIPKEWENVDQWPDADAKNRAYEVFKQLAALSPDICGATALQDEPGAVPALRFAPDAQQLFDTWREALEVRLRSGELSPVLTAHLAKYRSLMPSLALIFHLITLVDPASSHAQVDHGAGQTTAAGVSEAATAQAIAWTEYLESHAQRIYFSAANPALERAAALLAHVRAGDVSHRMVVRDIYRKQWSKLTTPDEVNDAITLLDAYGWVRMHEEKTGGRPTEYLLRHPSLRKFFKMPMVAS